MESSPVFFDPKGKRGKRFWRFTTMIVLAVGVLLTIFTIGIIFIIPTLPSLVVEKTHAPRSIAPPRPKRLPDLLTGTAKRELVREVSRSDAQGDAKLIDSSRIVLGFYAPWQSSTGLQSLTANATKLSHIAPEWLHLSKDGQSIDFSEFRLKSNPDNVQVIDIAKKNGIQVWPILNNSHQGVFDAKSVRLVLESPELQAKLAADIRAFLVSAGFQGLNLDFENLSRADYRLLPNFMAALNRKFKPSGLGLSVDLEADDDPELLRIISAQADWVCIMAYDEHSESDAAGPIASIDWVRNVVNRSLKSIPAEKVVIGVGNYAYDWTEGSTAGADHLTYQEALATAKGYRDQETPADVIEFDEKSLNSFFEYTDDNEKNHKVWILDAVSAYNQWRVSRAANVRGAAIWSLGSEDPGIWTFLDRKKFAAHLDPNQFRDVTFTDSIDYIGKGEILRVKERPSAGRREFDVDEESRLITDCSYLSYPLPYVVQHSGYAQKKLALTFDDGPDPQFTPAILDELKALNVPATFFIVGKNAELFPNIVKRMWDDGHEVGNHTFFHPNMSLVGTLRARLEMDAAQRSLETILGRSTIFFRPPYNADSEPRNASELRPIELASQKGYLSVGEKIDPNDWDLVVREADGSRRPKTADDIVRATIEQIAHFAEINDEGNVILLHDAGGDRTQTLQALRPLVTKLRAKGYEFVPVSALIGKTRDQVMPEVSVEDRWLIAIDKVVFTGVIWFDNFLKTSFVIAIGLGVLRMAIILPLAFIHDRQKIGVAPPGGFEPTVSVLIAAYNEANTIEETIKSVMASNYRLTEIIVIDDGSTDGTGDVIRANSSFANLVKLITKENGGKASALTEGLKEASGEIFVCIDADTQLDSHAIGHLIRSFADETVAAVAGNVRVGNATTVLTHWQNVEYTTSQNIDRRAQALLNALTVVPGAIGAWRTDVVRNVGGFRSDTLAEDMDLTWRIRAAGYRLDTNSDAIAYTEVPDTFGAFFKQRFRWTFGTLQCLWKHRRLTGRLGWFGRCALPALWIFQIFLQILAPLVDFQILFAAGGLLFTLLMPRGVEVDHMAEALNTLRTVGFLYALFFAIELVAGVLAYRMDRQSMRPLWWLFLQRFAYRQIMYAVVYKALLRAMRGNRQGWGKLDRKGTVTIPSGRS